MIINFVLIFFIFQQVIDTWWVKMRKTYRDRWNMQKVSPVACAAVCAQTPGASCLVCVVCTNPRQE